MKKMIMVYLLIVSICTVVYAVQRDGSHHPAHSTKNSAKKNPQADVKSTPEGSSAAPINIPAQAEKP